MIQQKKSMTWHNYCLLTATLNKFKIFSVHVPKVKIFVFFSKFLVHIDEVSTNVAYEGTIYMRCVSQNCTCTCNFWDKISFFEIQNDYRVHVSNLVHFFQYLWKLLATDGFSSIRSTVIWGWGYATN